MELQPSNDTFSFTLQIATFDVSPEAIYPVFVTGTLIYFFAVFCNVTILALIVTQQSLHKPMFYILFSLPLADLIGITCAFPRVLVDIVAQTNVVYYPTCVLQGFLLHMYGGSVLFILAAMSFDRYIAICKPLRYNSIMNPYTVSSVITLAWGLDFVMIVVLFALQARFPKCKTFIVNVFCDNVSLLQLSCGGDFTVNNIYGLGITGFMQGISLIIQLFSYVQILRVCLHHTQTDARIKAVNTCLAQVISFILYELVTSIAILSYRFQNVHPNTRKIFGMLIFTFLPVVNPILYGAKTRDIRKAFLIVLKKRKVMFT
ncbi:putative gustatory receptor clone PTE03 [Pangasianodon hypophthalmus]|uniref:putative gustatory receptor clone PTE03 n=1 Tax=Pangasianodon hypophthalmus TaxID=310915 RepID=UPI00147A1261|nr:putative gustatory receptor clone PTE03 [Pangasianodon hypophthalmus]